MAADPGPGYLAATSALLRAPAHSADDLPPWPDLTRAGPEHVAAWAGWLRQVWAIDGIAEAVGHASAELARTVCALGADRRPDARQTRRAVLAMTRYLLRMTGRPVPFGLMAGVALAQFAEQPQQHWGTEHRVVARAAAGWLADVTTWLEGCPDLLARLRVMASTTLVVRGDRLVVPYQLPGSQQDSKAAEVSLRCTPPVRAAVAAARAPIKLQELAVKVGAEFADAAPDTVSGMLAELVSSGALITSLHAPATEPDALAHLNAELQASGAASDEQMTGALSEIHALLQHHNHAPAGQARQLRRETATRMRSVAQTRRHPLALDVLLDASLVLPAEVARETERAALALTQLSACPAGTPAWRDYHKRFYERYGLGTLVPLLDVVSDSGIGWPAGYPGTISPEPPSALSGRDEMLLALAQAAALDGRDEAVLDEQLIAGLGSASVPLRPPPHLELGVRIHAGSQAALRHGDFRLEVTTVSRGAGVLTGRFLSVLPPLEQEALAGALACLPCGDRDTVPAQMSFPPLDPATGHVTRSPRILPVVISMAEYRPPGEEVVTAADLAVGCDGRRMYLAVPGRGKRVEAAGMHALNLLVHTPPLARFVIELSRAHCAQVTTFDWGAAARLPFLPRLRSGRTILSPARWRFDATSLPARQAPWREWQHGLLALLARRRVPRLVYLAGSGQQLPLDLDQDAHRVLLRAHLDIAGHAVLTEAPRPADLGWCGGRPREVIVPLTATQPPPWPRLPAPAKARVIGRDHGQLPATSPVLLAGLYGDIRRQDVILTRHLPDLLARLGQPPAWWYIRYRDPDQHLRLRISLQGPAGFGNAARTVSTWAGELRQAGLLSDVRFPASYPETGRWGSGPAWTAAEMVFQSDSEAMLAQLSLPARPGRHPLAAMHAVAIAAAWTGSTAAGMQWLIDHVPAAAPGRGTAAGARPGPPDRRPRRWLGSAPGSAWRDSYRRRVGGTRPCPRGLSRPAARPGNVRHQCR